MYRSIFFLTMVMMFLICNVFAQNKSEKEKPRKSIMVFGSHADDVEQIGGGTLAKYIAEGYEGVYVCVVNNLDGCNLERTPWFDEGPNFTVSKSPHKYRVGALETSQIREEEAKAAAAVFGAIPVFLNYKEPTFFLGRKLLYYGTPEYEAYNPPGRPLIALATIMSEEVDFVCDLLEKYKPEIVITHTLGGEKMDHGNTGYMMYLAFEQAKRRNIPVGKLWMPLNGWFLDETAQARGVGKPYIQVDVKKHLPVKYKALDKHVSQVGGFGRNYMRYSQTQSRVEGTEEFIEVLNYIDTPKKK